jgi:alkylation response protein AidB-like acyl-CoA dehydrogenase
VEFQSYAYGQNHFTVDVDLQTVLARYWRDYESHRDEMTRWGDLMGSEALEVGYHVDQGADPVLIMHDLDGNRVDRARIAPSQRDLLAKIAPMMRPAYDGGSWHHHYAIGYLLGDPGLYCIITITQQTAYALHKYAPELNAWEERLLSGHAWGATWMTEIQGGSDLGANRTIARKDGDRWVLSAGDKYFASGAGLADAAIATARPEGAPAGPKGLALFLVPRLRDDGSLNFTVRRLKEKSATRAVPSGEVELEGAEAFLIGAPEEGIYYTLENLTVSRLANAVAAMGIAKKAHLETVTRVQRRNAFGRSLGELPLIRRDMVDLAVRQAGGLAIAFHAVDAFDKAWHDRPPYTPGYHYARFLSHLAKNRTADHAAEITRLGMEIFGGLGFLEEYAVARWHREALITPIWEGPSNVQAVDMLEAMQKKHAHERFLGEFGALLEQIATPAAERALKTMHGTFADLATAEEPQWFAKRALANLADVATVALLYRLGDAGAGRYEKLADLYAARFLDHDEYPAWAMTDEEVG